jgi:cyclophilin family peptidyl-prolyl cis-trans isomerase
MYKFIIPLFALAFLLVSCDRIKDLNPFSSAPDATELAQRTPPPFDGVLITGKHPVVIHTSMGDITVEVDGDVAPRTVTNFINLSRAGYYDDLQFHRVIPNFMIQGGDPKEDGSGGASIFGPTFEDEINAVSLGMADVKLKDLAKENNAKVPANLANLTLKDQYEKMGYKYITTVKSLKMERGVIAMANRGPNTNGSQFFITTAAAPWLDGRHTVFGKVIEGMDVVDAISNAERDSFDKPVKAIRMTMEVK